MRVLMKGLPASLGLLLTVPGALGAPRPDVYPIRMEQVARAIVAAHPELAGSAVELPESPAARESAPVLEAGPAERWGSGAAVAHIRIRCQGEGVCLPFYASVHLAAPQATAAEKAVRETTPETVLRAGERAFMVIDSGRLHLRVPVTCLSSGAVGSTIRVAGPAHSKVFAAAVVNGSTVRGEL